MPQALAAGVVAAFGLTAGSAAAAIVSTAVVGAVYGAVIGGGMALIKGEDVLGGALKGAALGGITGGVMGGLEHAAGAASGAAGAGPGVIEPAAGAGDFMVTAGGEMATAMPSGGAMTASGLSVPTAGGFGPATVAGPTGQVAAQGTATASGGIWGAAKKFVGAGGAEGATSQFTAGDKLTIAGSMMSGLGEAYGGSQQAKALREAEDLRHQRAQITDVPRMIGSHGENLRPSGVYSPDRDVKAPIFMPSSQPVNRVGV